MKLTIDTQSYKEILLENHELFKEFLKKYYSFENSLYNEKYKINKLAINLFNNLEKDKLYIFQELENQTTNEIIVFKKKNYTHFKFYFDEDILQKLGLFKKFCLKPVSINKTKIKKINQNTIIKSYCFFNNNNDNYAYFIILNEIILQYYAYLLIKDYKSNHNFHFKVPKLYQVKKKTTKNGDIKISIYMEYIDQLEKKNIFDIYQYNDPIEDILIFLKKNYLFHNDTHNDNILFQKNGIVLIDFGHASLFKENIISDFSFYLGSKKKSVFDSWLKKEKRYFIS